MGQFDVDGLDDNQKDAFFEDASTFLAFATLLVLGFGISVAALYFQQIQQEALLREALEGLL